MTETTFEASTFGPAELPLISLFDKNNNLLGAISVINDVIFLHLKSNKNYIDIYATMLHLK